MGATATAGLLTFGESMGLFTAMDIGPIEFARDFRYGIGGAESNVATGAARLGADVTWIGRLGNDATGDLIERRLTAEGVRVRAIRGSGFTGIMMRHRRFAGHAEVDYHRAGSAASRLSPADIPDCLLRQASILHVTGITPALSTSAREAVFDAVERARGLGITVCVDVNFRAKLWERVKAASVLRTLASRADVLLATVDEARLILGNCRSIAPAELARVAAGLGPREVIIKDGARGCAALICDTSHEVPAPAVPVIDTVGAGDAFAAGYLAEHLAGLEPAQRLRTAVAAGAYAVTVPGDCEGMPRRSDLKIMASAARAEDAVR
jgi:2-dehydro-3-deoxygluconokinase